MTRYTLREALAPCWHEALVRMGMPFDPTPQQVVAWQAGRTSRDVVQPWVGEAIRRRAAGESVAAIAGDLEVGTRQVSARVRTGVPMLLAPWLGDVPAWRLGREQGRSTSDLAELYGVSEHLVTVALDGWPVPVVVGDDVAEQELEMWRAGADVEEIAEGLEVPVRRLRQWVRDGLLQLSPERVRPAQLAERFGWSPFVVTLYRRSGVLPVPDGARVGRPGREAPWWWVSTIDEVEQQVLVYGCEVCGARLATAKGLATHRTRKHGPAVQVDEVSDQPK